MAYPEMHECGVHTSETKMRFFPPEKEGILKNEAIQGWRVKSRIAGGCHVFYTPGNYRSVTIPKGIMGTLTGDVIVSPVKVNGKDCQGFAEDANRIKEALKCNILPDQEVNYSNGLNYWEQTKILHGENLLASRVALFIKWDGIYEQEPETLKCGSYIPWLELLE